MFWLVYANFNPGAAGMENLSVGSAYVQRGIRQQRRRAGRSGSGSRSPGEKKTYLFPYLVLFILSDWKYPGDDLEDSP